MRLFILLQYLLPHRLLSRLALWAARWRFRPWKNLLIGQAVKRFRVDMAEAAEPDPHAYPHFNAFFTRALKAKARVADPDPAALLCPADGTVSQAGDIRDGRIFQAKGLDYSVAELLGDAEAARTFEGGVFATIYLSPRDYHRVHMPLAGTLTRTVHVPGRLFSVNAATAASVPRLFARNERLVCLFDSDLGPLAMVMVGAMLVSGVETVWDGVAIPPYASRIHIRDWRTSQPPIHLDRFAEMARFNYGSTVVMLLPPGAAILDAHVAAGAPVRVGQRLGSILRASPHAAP
ncbi:MAG TPA: archaetidylserine decarboxylase [Xanthomonadaceae bacterium]|nr:archaetidylserine decarboxylase [Xanthomonadaceae bacterium]